MLICCFQNYELFGVEYLENKKYYSMLLLQEKSVKYRKDVFLLLVPCCTACEYSILTCDKRQFFFGDENLVEYRPRRRAGQYLNKKVIIRPSPHAKLTVQFC